MAQREARSGRVFSGIQPSGELHLGNYLGAVRHWVTAQEARDAFYCIVDLHAMSLPWEPAELRARTVETGALLIACGLDPKRSGLFVQSQVPAHAELSWILSCVARMGELRRMVQFKEKSMGASESVGVGLFTYPVLQAADVLLYRASGVPVGEDQRQHIELMRDLAVRFNRRFGDTFVAPHAEIAASGARIMSLDDPTQKMSKSVGGPGSKVLLIDPPEAITKKIRSAVTDSGRRVAAGEGKPALTNLITLYALAEGSSVAAVEERFSSAGYGEFKNALADLLVATLAPIRQRYDELISDRAETERLLGSGAAAAAEVAETTMRDVRARVGLPERAAPS